MAGSQTHDHFWCHLWQLELGYRSKLTSKLESWIVKLAQISGHSMVVSQFGPQLIQKHRWWQASPDGTPTAHVRHHGTLTSSGWSSVWCWCPSASCPSPCAGAGRRHVWPATSWWGVWRDSKTENDVVNKKWNLAKFTVVLVFLLKQIGVSPGLCFKLGPNSLPSHHISRGAP